MQRPQADLGSFIRAWFLFLLRLYSAFVCYSVITSVFRRWRARLENDFGRVCDLRKIFVVCSTRKCLGRMLTATERLILAVLSILEYSTVQRRFILCSVLQKVWSCICSILERVWFYVTSFVAIFFVGLFFRSRPCRDEKGNQQYSP